MTDNLGGRDRQVRGAGYASQGGTRAEYVKAPASERGGIRNRPASMTLLAAVRLYVSMRRAGMTHEGSWLAARCEMRHR